MTRIFVTLALVFTGLLIITACKKEEPPAINPCMNGQLDPGETGIDCGGDCGACPDTEFPYAGFTLNGHPLSASTKQLTHTNNGWTLFLATDSVTLQLNFGNNGSLGIYSINPSGSAATLDGVNYPVLDTGVYTITAHNLQTEKLSGFFQGKFVRAANDTLFITNGYFEHLPY